MKFVTLAAIAVLSLVGLGESAQAKGCVGGAVVGGVAGHFAGHHPIVGAAAGCLVGRHMAKTKAAKQQAAQAQHR
jgi:hypothetical protein